MAAEIQELYPNPGGRRALKGTYLDDDVLALGSPEQPFIYANFVSSLDGRIAVDEAGTGESYVLDDLTSGNDFRLFQELQAQADCLVTHSGYLRALEEQKLGDILQVGLSKKVRDIGAWREAHGLIQQPAVAVVSRSLDFPLPASLERYGQPVYIITGAAAPRERVAYWRERGCTVISSGPAGLVEGGEMARALGERGYRRLYLLTGPQMLSTVIADGVLSRLYLTLTHQVIGGETFHTLAFGPVLKGAGRLKLRSVYFDPDSPRGAGQWFSSFEVRGAEG